MIKSLTLAIDLELKVNKKLLACIYVDYIIDPNQCKTLFYK
jgi:hypothetical protein